MIKAFKPVLGIALAYSCAIPWSLCQEIPDQLAQEIDAVIEAGYRTASENLPCKVKTRGKPKMLRWEVVDRCLKEATDRVDWEELSSRLRAIQTAAPGVSPGAFRIAVENSLEAQALPFEKVFLVNKNEGYLPLTNSLLRHLPQDSLADMPVIDKFGTELGTFAGVYSYERTGGTVTGTYRLSLFQYRDRNGNIQSAAEKLLLDSYGIPWERAMTEPGFRIPIEKFSLEN